jgi:ABC-type multidrug transport system fused ATPase/permease subunit
MKQFNFLLKSDDIIKLSILLLSLIITTFLELVGIGSIPVFVTAIFNPELIFEKVPYLNNFNFVSNLESDELILIIVALVILVFLIKNFFIVFVNYFTGQINISITSALFKNLFYIYTHSNYIFYLNRNSSELIRNLSSEVGRTVKYLMSYFMLIRETLILISIFILLFSVDYMISSVTFFCLGSFTLIFYILTKRGSKKRGEILQYHGGQKIKVISQSINSIKQIKILSKEGFVNKIFNTHINAIEKHDFIQRMIMTLPRIFFELISVFTILLISVIYIYSERDFDNFIPFISLITIASLRLIPSFTSISTSIAGIKYNYPSFKLIKNEIENSDIHNRKKPLTGSQQEIEFKDIIEIQNVNFQYPNTKTQILENINLKIEFGEIIGIAGKSGEGKSTLLDLIVGLLKPTSGKILIDGKEFANDVNTNWIKNVGYVPQDTYLLDDTIKANIAFGEEKENFNYQNYKEAIKLAQLDKFINNLENKEDTIVGEKGIRLSGGQRQRISLARCFYFKPKLIILDEPTSSLDVENEKKIIDDLYSLKIKVTLIIISHRYSIFKKCKRIFNLNNKNLNKFDNFEELLNHNNYRDPK